jgi:hypothetical protein
VQRQVAHVAGLNLAGQADDDLDRRPVRFS